MPLLLLGNLHEKRIVIALTFLCSQCLFLTGRGMLPALPSLRAQAPTKEI